MRSKYGSKCSRVPKRRCKATVTYLPRRQKRYLQVRTLRVDEEVGDDYKAAEQLFQGEVGKLLQDGEKRHDVIQAVSPMRKTRGAMITLTTPPCADHNRQWVPGHLFPQGQDFVSTPPNEVLPRYPPLPAVGKGTRHARCASQFDVLCCPL